MISYRVQVIGDKYPTEYLVQATGWSAATTKAIQQWKKRFKGSRTKELKIKVIKGGIPNNHGN